MADYKSPTHEIWNNQSAVWLVIKTRELAYQKQLYVRDGSINAPYAGPTFEFMLPMTWQENIAHEWEPYETIMARLGQKVATAYKTVSQARDAIRGNLNAPPLTKIDSPLLYKNSSRLEYTFTIDMAHGMCQPSIMGIVKALEKLSTPSYIDGIKIKEPNVFHLYTRPGGLINIKYAIISAIQPTYIGPYNREGEPTKCELSITFQDMEPLFRENIEGPVINVGA